MNAVAGVHLEKIARGGTASLAGAGVSAVANFAVVVVITQSYSKADAGVLFSVSSLFLIVLAVVGLGMDTGLGRFLLRHVVDERWDWARSCLRNTALVTVITGSLGTIGLWVSASPLARMLGLPVEQGTAVIRVFAAAVLLSAVGNWALGASRAFANIRQTVMIDKLARSLLQLLLVSVCAWLALSVTALSAAWVIPSVLMAPVAVWGLARVVRRKLPKATGRVAVPEANREFWRFTTPRSIAQVAQLVVQRLDIILIGAMISPAAAAVYTAATRFVPLGQLGAQAISQVVQPRFTHLLATNQKEALGEVFRTTTAWNIAIAWPLYLVVGSMAPLYLRLFGPGFAADGFAVVLVMVVGMLIGVASGPVDTILLMAGRSWLSLSNALVALVVSVVGCLVLIPILGIVGAAVAWCASVVAKSVLGYVQVRRHVGLSALSRASAIAALASLVAFGVPGAVLSIAGAANVLSLVLLLALGGAVYVWMMWRWRSELRLESLRSLLPRKVVGP